MAFGPDLMERVMTRERVRQVSLKERIEARMGAVAVGMLEWVER